jgi:hypothetical protein
MRRSHVTRRELAALALGAVLSLAVPMTAAAGQEETTGTRTERLEAERDARAAEATPPQRSMLERALLWYDDQQVLARMLGGWRGFHGASGNFPAGAGTAVGIGYSAGGATGLGVDIAAATSTRGYARGSVALDVRQLGGAPVDVTVRGQMYEFPEQDFFGLGMDSDVDARSNYLLSNAEAGADVTWRPMPGVSVQAGLTYLSPRAGVGTDTRMASTNEAFDPATLPGYGTATDYFRSEIGVAYDRRDNPLHPHAGGRYSARVADYRDLDSAGFWRADVDAQQYVPIPDRYRTLALRATATLTDPHDGQDVPFYFQPTLGGASTLRGFREFRFQDRNSVAVSAEYRWEAWWALDGAVFVDAGTVAPERRALALRDVEVSYGVGLRLHSNSAFVARIDFAFSREGFIPLLRFDHVF